MIRSRRIHILFLVGTMALAACSRTETPDLRRMVPELSEDMARHLTVDSPASFKLFARTAGVGAVSTAYNKLFLAPRTDSLALFEKDEAQLAPYLEKLGQVLNDEYNMIMVPKRQQAYFRRTLAERREIVCVKRDIWALVFNDTIPVQAKADAYMRLIGRSLPYADAFSLADMYATYANFLPRISREDSMAYYLDLGLKAAIEVGDLEVASQTLGTLGAVYGRRGEATQMQNAWSRGIELARKVDSPQECRLLSFQAAAYLREGRFALSRDLSRRAQDRCRELGARNMEIRFLIDSLYLFWALDCWPVLDRYLQRADALLREADADWIPAEKRGWAIQVNRYRNLYLAGTGACGEVESVSAQMIRDLAGISPASRPAPTCMDLASSLRHCGKLEEALPIIEESIATCRKEDERAFLPALDLELAEIQFARGHYPEARQALRMFEKDEGSQTHDSPSRGWSRHDALRVCLDLKAGDRRSAQQELITALHYLQKQWRGMDLSPDAAMALPVAAKLGDLAHELLDTSAEMGYARELDWLMHIGGIVDADFPTEDAALVRMAREALKRLDREKTAHCVYHVEDDRVLRWTAYNGKVVRDELPITLKDLQRRVSLFRHSVLAPSDSLAGQARELMVLFLPSFLLTQNGPRRVFITPDGPLRQLPFEALNVSPGSYEPFMRRVDVAYVLYDRPLKAEPSGSVLTVSDPAYSPYLKRQYSILTEALPAGIQEAVTFAGFFANTTSLRGTEATKAQLLKTWSEAESIYFACHTVQDPEIPYITFIPLASSSTGPKEDAYLDLVDARSADLSRCGLVVLSSCGSGTSFLNGRLSAPSLAQAFLQAGARAVISTSWNVKDGEAAQVMHVFAGEYASTKDPVRALNVARRQLLEQGASLRVWASYSVMLGSI